MIDGIGPSGVSRSLILLDGVPLNNPFGGWVYWSKVPLESIEQIEVARGGGSALHGNYALGGVINIVTQKVEATEVRGKIDGALRFDYWQNGEASRTDRSVATRQVTRTPFADKTNTAVSPKFAILYWATDALALRASAYQAFRTPTLNELYRQFRVGNVVMLANADLGPERLTGDELGLDYNLGEQWLAKLTGFWNELKDLISNVTLSAPIRRWRANGCHKCPKYLYARCSIPQPEARQCGLRRPFCRRSV